MFIQRLQDFAQAHSVRVTILGGDVHLAAVGRFYSRPKLAVPAGNDHRFIVNIVSSAITNKPPPKAVANLLAQRNKLHHLDENTDETLMDFVDEQPGGVEKSSASNKTTMPSRNFACITEIDAVDGAEASGAANGFAPSHAAKDGHSPLHKGEENAGSKHPAADGVGASDMYGGLDVSIKVEIDPKNREGATHGYGFSSKFALSFSVLVFPSVCGILTYF